MKKMKKIRIKITNDECDKMQIALILIYYLIRKTFLEKKLIPKDFSKNIILSKILST